MEEILVERRLIVNQLVCTPLVCGMIHHCAHTLIHSGGPVLFLLHFFSLFFVVFYFIHIILYVVTILFLIRQFASRLWFLSMPSKNISNLNENVGCRIVLFFSSFFFSSFGWLFKIYIHSYIQCERYTWANSQLSTRAPSVVCVKPTIERNYCKNYNYFIRKWKPICSTKLFICGIRFFMFWYFWDILMRNMDGEIMSRGWEKKCVCLFEWSCRKYLF